MPESVRGKTCVASGFVSGPSQPIDDQHFGRWWTENGEHELRQLLYWKWDPLGVNYAFPNTADEYDQYAPEVVSALRDGGSETEIVELLSTIERQRIGVPRDRTNRLPEFVQELGASGSSNRRRPGVASDRFSADVRSL